VQLPWHSATIRPSRAATGVSCTETASRRQPEEAGCSGPRHRQAGGDHREGQAAAGGEKEGSSEHQHLKAGEQQAGGVVDLRRRKPSVQSE
jgi:hypothetical protein